MGFHLSESAKRAIIAIKINEIEMSEEFSEKDKAQLKKYYRKQLPAKTGDR
jgi:hypothetical protein